jgi:glycopeptide antibiotics resistance protein
LTQLIRVVHQLVPVALLALAAGIALVIGLAMRRRRSGRGFAEAWSTAALDVALLLTAAAIAILTLSPGLEGGRMVELIPFQDILRTLRQTSASDTQLWALVANVMLFVPLGVLVPLRFRRWDGLGRITVMCAAISTGIEVIQFVVGSHSTATDDVMLNTLGGALGYLATRAVRRILERRRAGGRAEARRRLE